MHEKYKGGRCRPICTSESDWAAGIRLLIATALATFLFGRQYLISMVEYERVRRVEEEVRCRGGDVGDRRCRTAHEGLHPPQHLTTEDRLGWTTQLQHAYLSSLSHSNLVFPRGASHWRRFQEMLLGVAGLAHDHPLRC